MQRGEHRLTDEECEALCKGESIELEFTSKKTGKPYKVSGKLSHQEYNGHKFVCVEYEFVQTKREIDPNDPPQERYEGKWNGRDVSFKRLQRGEHRLTDEECEALCAGLTIQTTFTSKNTGKPYTVNGKLAEQEFKGHKYICVKYTFDNE